MAGEHMDFSRYIKNGFRNVIEATKISNSLPSQKMQIKYSIYECLKIFKEGRRDRVLHIMNSLITRHEIADSFNSCDLHEKTELIIEANDFILEKVANYIDELNGIKNEKKEKVQIQTVSSNLFVNGSWNKYNNLAVSSDLRETCKPKDAESVTLLTAKNIVKPQISFKDKVDNSNAPWVPRIFEKPNSIKPLTVILEEIDFGKIYCHPYEFELEQFNPSAGQLQKHNSVFPKSLENTPLYEINDPEQLYKVLEDLKEESEIAIDLEHHSYRSYLGITCLMQISTIKADYIIDTLALREKVYILNDIFTNSAIVKIFHGASSDIEWLQRDLSLYVVNMFDTHIAAKELGYPALSLSYLMTKFCEIKPNKHFQLADWRIRPLPEMLKTYARMDTHFLIFIYQMMKNELLQRANGNDYLLKSVIHQSKLLCMKRYIKPTFKENTYLDFYRKSKRVFDNRQIYALKELFRWRDSIARKEDESTGYVLPNHMLLQMCEKLPREMQGILACCNPIPILVKSNLLELHQLILKAREQPIIKPIIKENNRSRGCTSQRFKINVERLLHCPHDMSKQEFRDDLITVVKDINSKVNNFNSEDLPIEQIRSVVTIFALRDSFDSTKKAETKAHKLKFLGPFERYELVKPYVTDVESKEIRVKNEIDKESTDADDVKALHFKFASPSLPFHEATLNTSFIKNEALTIQGNNSSLKKSEGASSERKRNRTMTDDLEETAGNRKYYTKRVRKEKGNNRCDSSRFNGKQDKLSVHSQLQKQKRNNKKIYTDNTKLKKKPWQRNKQKKNGPLVDSCTNNGEVIGPFDYSSVNYSQFKNNDMPNLGRRHFVKFNEKIKNKNAREIKNQRKQDKS